MKGFRIPEPHLGAAKQTHAAAVKPIMRNMWNLSPFSEVRHLSDWFDKLPLGESRAAPAGCLMDVYEQDGSLVVRAAVPGVRREDLKLSIDDHVLTLAGEVRDEQESRGDAKVYHRETFYGRFSRSIRLPENLDEDAIDAEMQDGCVVVTIPRKQRSESQPRKLSIRGGGGATRVRPEEGAATFDAANEAASEVEA
jgi:HSP20 family protein